MKAQLRVHFGVVKAYRICLLGEWREICDKALGIAGGWVPLRGEYFLQEPDGEEMKSSITQVRVEAALHDYGVISFQEAGEKYELTEGEVLAMEAGKVIWRGSTAIYAESEEGE